MSQMQGQTELVLIDPMEAEAELKQDFKRRDAKITTYLLTRTKSCPACSQQEMDLEPFKSKPFFSDIIKIDLDASEANLEVAKTLALEYTPSFLFVKNHAILKVNDPYAESKSLLSGAQKPIVLERIFNIIDKNDKGFEAIMQKTCESCKIKSICILNHLFHIRLCKMHWRNKKYNVFIN